MQWLANNVACIYFARLFPAICASARVGNTRLRQTFLSSASSSSVLVLCVVPLHVLVSVHAPTSASAHARQRQLAFVLNIHDDLRSRRASKHRTEHCYVFGQHQVVDLPTDQLFANETECSDVLFSYWRLLWVIYSTCRTVHARRITCVHIRRDGRAFVSHDRTLQSRVQIVKNTYYIGSICYRDVITRVVAVLSTYGARLSLCRFDDCRAVRNPLPLPCPPHIQ